MLVDFMVRSAYLLDHLVPVWDKLDPNERGAFYVQGERTLEEASKRIGKDHIQHYQDGGYCGDRAIVAASYGDAVRAADWNSSRPVILMEHGVGMTFGKAAYADGLGQREKFAMLPVQSEYVLKKVHPELRNKPHPVIGVPKMDPYVGMFLQPHPIPKFPTVVVSFHHGDSNSRPGVVGSAWEHYIDTLPLLSKRYKLMVHFHPSSSPRIREVCEQWGLPIVESFEWVLKNADLYVNDCSSTLYEFCVTGKPVILLNAPWFDKKEKWGIRFWDYADVGIQVDDPSTLDSTIEHVLANPDEHKTQRYKAVKELFPYFGVSSQRMVEELRSLLKSVRPSAPQAPQAKKKDWIRIPEILKTFKVQKGVECGIVYMCFGSAALHEMEKSVLSLRKTGSTVPVAVVGDEETISSISREDPALFSHLKVWDGESPFDSSKKSNFQFRAGRVKPFLWRHSPFENTMYVDCDTEFLACPDDSFGWLKHWDFVIAQERLMLSELYNRRNVNWEHDIAERDATIRAYGSSNGDFPFWNSGVFWWRKNKLTQELFDLWYSEWLLFQGWDEQKALMRAGNFSKARIFVVGEIWNYPHREEIREKINQPARIILHEYGKGQARTDVTS